MEFTFRTITAEETTVKQIPVTSVNEKHDMRTKHKKRQDRMGAYRINKRPFIAIDGEGWFVNGRHTYTVFAALCDADRENIRSVANPEGLKWDEIRDLLFGLAARYPESDFIVFGGSYDANMILELMGLSATHLVRLRDRGKVRFGATMIEYRQGKMLQFTRVFGGVKQRVRIYDVISYFQSTFVKACESYFGEEFPYRELIEENKNLRGEFHNVPIDQIVEYNRCELLLLLDLMNQVRTNLYRIGLFPQRWDGPGAVAEKLLQRHRIKDAMHPTPDTIQHAVQSAYFGGRFEVFQHGWHAAPSWQYDINSAYPSACLHLPDLNKGTWIHRFEKKYHFSLHKVHVRAHPHYESLPHPIPHRTRVGTIFFPPETVTWIWRPELDALEEWKKKGYGRYKILESWTFRDNGKRPFGFMRDMFEQRLRLKEPPYDGTEKAIKLAINSVYGKLAQQVGAKYSEKTERWRLPSFHQLEWAGYITSYCRAQLYRAMLPQLDTIIAVETDALFTTSEAPHVIVSTRLGSWDRKRRDEIIYLQSGVYFDPTTKDVPVKARGIQRGDINPDQIIDVLNRFKASQSCDGFAGGDTYPHVTVTQTNFIGFKTALRNVYAHTRDGIQHMQWCQWYENTKTLALYPNGKRISMSFHYDGKLNATIPGEISALESTPHKLEWIDNPAARDVARAGDYEWSDDEREDEKWENNVGA